MIASTHQPDFAKFAQSIQPDPFEPMRPPNPEGDKEKTAMSQLATQLGQPISSKLTTAQLLGDALKKMDADDALRDACQAANQGKIRATRVETLDKQLFPDATKSHLVSDAMRGLLLALSAHRRGYSCSSSLNVFLWFSRSGFNRVWSMWRSFSGWL